MSWIKLIIAYNVDESEALGLIQLSVTLAKDAGQNLITSSNGRLVPIVAGSVGPYGACQHDGSEYHGNYVDHMTHKELMEWHQPRVRELLTSGADILACETIPAKVYKLQYGLKILMGNITYSEHVTQSFLAQKNLRMQIMVYAHLHVHVSELLASVFHVILHVFRLRRKHW